MARPGTGGARKFRCRVAYDGTPYSGFQAQPGRPTVQQELEAAMQRITRRATRVVPAGRTDAGVHATGQVIHFLSGWRHEVAALERALNAVLPETVAVAGLAEADPAFHARYSARSRRYRYDIWNGPRRSPMRQRYTLHRARPLDAGAMHAALQLLVGTHDFRAFAAGEDAAVCTVRAVIRVACQREGELVRVYVEANAFVRHMMRRIVGTLLEIGEGRKPPAHLERVVRSGDKALAGPTAPARGLCLIRVSYPDAPALETMKEDHKA